MSFCSLYAEVQLEVGLGGLRSFVASKGGKGWLLISNPRLVLPDRQIKSVSFLALIHSDHLQIQFELLGRPRSYVDGKNPLVSSRGCSEQQPSVLACIERDVRPSTAAMIDM